MEKEREKDKNGAERVKAGKRKRRDKREELKKSKRKKSDENGERVKKRKSSEKDKENAKRSKKSKKVDENSHEVEEIRELKRKSRDEQNEPVARNALERQSSSDLQISTSELDIQMSECLKLNAEDKITYKNAFQLKMIDFLSYSLKNHNPNLSNLNMASVCLDVSGKIYGLRVDKVHADLYRIFGVYLRNLDQDGDEDGNQSDCSESNANAVHPKRRKRKKIRRNIIATAEALKGNVDTYNPFSLMNSQKDTLTSDRLLQAHIPQHAKNGILCNTLNDVIIDQILPHPEKPSKIKIHAIESYESEPICKTYQEFRFLDGVSAEKISALTQIETDNHASQYRFSLSDDDTYENEDLTFNNDSTNEEPKDLENGLIDFESAIQNNPNPDPSYEYNYLQTQHKLRWMGPSHWKIMNKDSIQIKPTKLAKNIKTKRPRKNAKILSFTEDYKDKILSKFAQKKFDTTFQDRWTEEKILIPKKVEPYDCARLLKYYTKADSYILPNVRENTDNHDDFDCLNSTGDFDNEDDPILHSTAIEEVENSKENSTDDAAIPGEDATNNGGIPISFDEPVIQRQRNLVARREIAVPRNPEPVAVRQRKSFSFDVPRSNSQNVQVDPAPAQEVPRQNDPSRSDVPEVQTAAAATIGDLLPIPRVIETPHIPHAMRPKKINMRQLQRTVWKNIKINRDESGIIEIKSFKSVYLEIPGELSNTNFQSLSPALAFSAILHLAHSKHLILKNSEDFSDVYVSNQTAT